MDCKQRVKINKLLGYLSPFDTSRITSPSYIELKRSTQESLYSNQSLTSLSTRVPSHNNGGTSLHRRPKKLGQASQQLPAILENGSAHPQQASASGQSALLDYQMSGKHVRSSTQLQQSKPSQSHQPRTLAVRSSESNSLLNQSSIGLSKSIMVQPNQYPQGNPPRHISLDISKNILNPNSNNNSSSKTKEQKSFFIVEEAQPQVWSELKFCGKLCEGRSFATAIEHNNVLYIYGGYDATKGVFGDFISLKLSDTTPSSFEPVSLADSNSFYPGRLCRYGAIKRENKMIVFGGKPSSLSNTNVMFEFCFDSKSFKPIESTLANHEGPAHTENQMPPLDSHSLSYDSKSDSLVVFGGFLGQACAYSNAVYTFAFSTNQWTYHSMPESAAEATPNAPPPRGSHAAALLNDTLYIYGGCAGETVFEDLWKFNLASKKWTEIQTIKQTNHPGPRSGIQFIVLGEYLILFGGFKSLVNERNDLNVFNTTTNEWVYQSTRREIYDLTSPLRYNNNNNNSINDRDFFGLSSEQSSRMLGNSKKHKLSSQYNQSSHSLLLISRPVRGDFSSQSQMMSFQEDERYSDAERSKRIGDSDTSRIKVNAPNQQRHHFGSSSTQEKKMALLKLFETTKEARKLLIQPSPIHQSMNSSLHSLGMNAANPQAMHEAKTEVLNRASRFTSTEAKITGKHPGARDGYLCTILSHRRNGTNARAVFFGGDRHRMSLNDAYELDLDLLLKSLKSKS